MKRIVTAIFASVLAPVLLFSSCTTATKTTEDTSYITADTIEESGVLTAVYRETFSVSITSAEKPTPMFPDGDSLRYALAKDTTGFQVFIGTDATDPVIPGDLMESAAAVHDGYLCLSNNRDLGIYTLHALSSDGKVLASVPADSTKPNGCTAAFPGESDWYTNAVELPCTSTDDGYAIVWGNTVVYLDRDLAVTGQDKLASTIYHIRRDDVTGELWAHLSSSNGMILHNVTTGTDYALPERFQSNDTFKNVKLTAVHDGYAYGFDEFAAFRWKISDGSEIASPEEVLNFSNSNINGQNLLEAWPVFTSDGTCFTVKYRSETDAKWILSHCTPVGEVNLADIVTLELAHVMGPSVNQAIVEFNQKNTGVRIIVNDYTRFDSSEGMSSIDRMRTDLETGVIKPDLIITSPNDYLEMAEGMKEYFVDLSSVEGEKYSADDIWNSVTDNLTVNGGLYGMAAEIEMIQGHIGLDSVLPTDHWSVGEFIDYIGTVPADEHLVKIKNASEFYAGNVFGYHVYDDLIRTDGFKSPEYLRYLKAYRDLATNAKDTPDTALYRDGTIHLLEADLRSSSSILSVMREFGVTDPEELCFIGYPSPSSEGEFEGFELSFGSGIYSITKHCENIPAAWSFIEQAMDTAAAKKTSETDPLSYMSNLTVLREPLLEQLRSLEGSEIFFEYGTGTGVCTYASLTDYDLRNREGITFTLDERYTNLWIKLLDGAELSFINRRHMPMLNIIQQEENAFFNGETTAENAQVSLNSRINLWLAEHGME
ncbi:MAG: hypothetical protein IJ037_06225 [Clostridia bacterium]|nr:hypothetical protein [Clostridia bacterium]